MVLDSQRSAYLCLLSAGVTDMRHMPHFLFKILMHLYICVFVSVFMSVSASTCLPCCTCRDRRQLWMLVLAFPSCLKWDFFFLGAYARLGGPRVSGNSLHPILAVGKLGCRCTLLHMSLQLGLGTQIQVFRLVQKTNPLPTKLSPHPGRGLERH